MSDSALAVQVEGVDPATPANPSEPPSAELLGAAVIDDPLHEPEAFRRFVGQVTLSAPRWLEQRCVPPADREDVLQDALLQAFKRRGSYDPATSSWKGWAFGIVGRVVLNYRRVRARRIKRVDVATAALPDVAVDGPTPEEETEAVMNQTLFDTCMARLDADARAILLARAEGQVWAAVAMAFGVSVATARRHYDEAYRKLQAAIDYEQSRNKALGAMVVPITVAQLLASDPSTGDLAPEAMGRIWEAVERAIAEDVAVGKVGDGGTDASRSMGSPTTAPRTPLAARVARAVGPRGVSALTHLGTAAVSAVLTYALLTTDPTHRDTIPATRPAASSMAAHLGYSHHADPPERAASSGEPRGDAAEKLERRLDAGRDEQAAPAAARPAGAADEPERHPSAGAAERTDAGPGPKGAGRDDLAAETALYDVGASAYHGGYYGDAIKAFREHARKYPQGQMSEPRDRLWTLALIHMGKTAEARQRIERLRRTSPESPFLQDFDRAMDAPRP